MARSQRSRTPTATAGSSKRSRGHLSRVSARVTSVPVEESAKEVEGGVEVGREAATIVLYVSVVEIAEFAALPEGHFAHGRVTGPVDAQLLAILWGTAVGLALAHWFAFRVAAPGFRGESPTRRDV